MKKAEMGQSGTWNFPISINDKQNLTKVIFFVFRTPFVYIETEIFYLELPFLAFWL